MQSLPFHLQENEKIIQQIKPSKVFILLNSISTFFLFFFFGIFISIFSFVRTFKFLGLFFVLIFAFGFALFSLVMSVIRYSKERYWITNQRVIFQRGFLGYSITSLPLERIVDVVISRSFIQQIFNAPSLHLDTFGSGIVGAGGYYGQNAVSKGSMLAISNPEGLQKEILELVKKKRKTEKLSM